MTFSRILRASSLGLLVRSVGAGDLNRTALLMDDRERPFWRYADEIAGNVPTRPIPIVRFEDLAGPVGRPEADLPARDLLFWSPAVEQTAGVTARLCERWPDAALYTIIDKAGLSRVYAAHLKGSGWAPALPAEQWSMTRCPPRESSAGSESLGSDMTHRGAFVS